MSISSNPSFDVNQSQDLESLSASLSQDTPEDKLYTYILIRKDLNMPPGKMASQAIHASRLSLLKYLKDNPHRAEEFITLNTCGSAVTLLARHIADLERAQREAEQAGLPYALFSDSGHIMPPHFLGDPITTALAIGPAPREAMRSITKRFQCA